jgi:hypothetical protein
MKIYAIVIVLGFAFSCTQKPDFPLEPSITFSEITVTKVKDPLTSLPGRDAFKDSVSISINYRDGDGNLGVNDADKDKLAEKGEFNFIVKRSIRIKGKYYEYDPLPKHSGNFITLKTGGKIGPIEGTIHYGIDFLPLNGPKKDTLKFDIQIMDREGNRSNIVTTDSVLVNEINKKNLKI